MHDKINKALKKVAEEQEFNVLYACESGSRAWGFGSPDSDYDVRFIYVHDQDWYLNLEKKKDTYEVMLPDELDLSGWELRKTLTLFAGCNLALNEWLGSPEVYYANSDFISALRALIPDYFNARKAMFHYLGMAGKTYGQFSLDDITIKKIFYILRPLLACEWIKVFNTMPPTEFSAMLNAGLLSEDLLALVNDLLEEKKTALEGDKIAVAEPLADWIKAAFAKYGEIAQNLPVTAEKSWQPLNKLVKEYVLG